MSVSLGRHHRQQMDAQHVSMATICRISRSVMFPPQFRHMHEWFQYAFSSSDLDEVARFPITEFERSEGLSPTFGDGIGQEGKRRISASPKNGHHHNKEVIFALPSFLMDLKTEHLQGPKSPSTSDSKPTIESSFVTDFDDHIFVAVDAEAYFFLHDLIQSYIREKDVSVSGKTQSPSSNRNQGNSDSTEVLHTDWREFVCQSWHLEPTVRLLSWAGKNIEPYGVDYILQRLGFSQARTTIPKWIQRGAMDPLDKILSLVMYRIIRANAVEIKPIADSSKGNQD
ncbi:putative transmembrane protein [Halotydeus destructor]|nr:putative transmembrane protein [Halotydeus destructor]